MNTSLDATKTAKQDLRTRYREHRSRLDVSDLAYRTQGFAQSGADLVQSLDLAEGTAVTGFLPFGEEPPILDLLGILHSRGLRVYVPVCLPRRQLAFTQWRPGVTLEPGVWPELVEPVGERYPLAEVGPALMLVPALAVDSSGTRLGQGAGYFDRALASLTASNDGVAPRPVLAGVVHAEEVSDAPLPRDGWDFPMDYALTQEFFTPLAS